MDTVETINLVGKQFKHPHSKRYFKNRVLLVEDSQESEDLMRSICEEVDPDMHLKCVKTAEEAEQILKSNPRYNLIIADHYLAGRATGLDLWRTCQDGLIQIPFVMTSTLETQEFFEMVDPLIKSGWKYPRFLPKPVLMKLGKNIIERQLTVEALVDQTSVTSGSYGKDFHRSRWDAVEILIAFVMVSSLLLVPAQIRIVQEHFSDDFKKIERDSQPVSPLSPQKPGILEPQPKRPMEIRDIATPATQQMMVRIEERADKIREALKFHPETWRASLEENNISDDVTADRPSSTLQNEKEGEWEVDVD